MIFYGGGHIGDTVYQLYTIKKAGGGHLVLGPGQQQMWGVDEIHALQPLCEYQSYIESCKHLYSREKVVDHDFTSIGSLRNHEEFFEWDERVWPGNCHLKKRYYNSYFRDKLSTEEQLRNYNQEETWLDAPDIEFFKYDIVFHAPHRKLADRSTNQWMEILEELSRDYGILLIGGKDIDEWPESGFYKKDKPEDFLRVASYIKSSRLFLGLSSCAHVIAEGLDVVRFIDMAPQTEGSEPSNQRGWDITEWDHERVVTSVKMILH